jgi:hypothetical protein
VLCSPSNRSFIRSSRTRQRNQYYLPGFVSHRRLRCDFCFPLFGFATTATSRSVVGTKAAYTLFFYRSEERPAPSQKRSGHKVQDRVFRVRLVLLFQPILLKKSKTKSKGPTQNNFSKPKQFFSTKLTTRLTQLF